jgi:hypothetical protein
MREGIVPKIMGENWFNFSGSASNIYNSYKFLEYYKDSLKIDTLIIGIEPHDFVFSYIKNRDLEYSFPVNNKDYIIFGKDSISKIGQYPNHYDIIKYIQVFINDFPKINDLFRNNTKLNKVKENDVWTHQGYSAAIYAKDIDLDTLFLKYPEQLLNPHYYFYNVRDIPNMYYFDLFNQISKEIAGNVFFLSPPKSKHYFKGLEEMEYDSKWNNIIDSIENRNVNFLNYTYFNTDSFNFNFFMDETHLSVLGAKEFSKIIKNDLSLKNR